MRWARVVNHLRSSLWLVPVACVLFGFLLSLGSIAIDSAADYSLIPRSFTGGPDAALAILSTIAASMVSLAALVLTITMVVVQLAMGQFSPRIVQNFLRDKPSQFAVGLFVATFVHAMLTLREVQLSGGGSVPGVAILVSYVLVVVSVVVLVLYVHHIGRSLRVSALIELVGSDARKILDDRVLGATGRTRALPNTIPARRSGGRHRDRRRCRPSRPRRYRSHPTSSGEARPSTQHARSVVGDVELAGGGLVDPIAIDEPHLHLSCDHAPGDHGAGGKRRTPRVGVEVVDGDALDDDVSGLPEFDRSGVAGHDASPPMVVGTLRSCGGTRVGRVHSPYPKAVATQSAALAGDAPS
jgi:Predicted membrane protein (DUF2254)